MMKINLGCGPVGKDDWINVDWGILAIMQFYSPVKKICIKLRLFPKAYDVKWPKNLKLHDCRKGLPFNSNSTDFIYTSHFLEHLKKYEAKKLIEECYRVLKNGGIIRVVVPDLELLVKKYLEKDIGFFKKFSATLIKRGEGNSEPPLADYLVDNFYPDFYKQKFSLINRFMNLFIRPHLWMYDYESLRNLLEGLGFKNISRKLFKEGKVPDLDILDIFPEVSLYVEAQK